MLPESVKKPETMEFVTNNIVTYQGAVNQGAVNAPAPRLFQESLYNLNFLGSAPTNIPILLLNVNLLPQF